MRSVPPPVHMLSLATATPPHRMSQDAVEAAAAAMFRDRANLFERLRPAYGNAGVAQRWSCVPLEWYAHPHGWKERSRLYVDHALELCAGLTRTCLARAGLELDDVDAVVVVSSTGITTPSLDALLMERLALRRDVTRLPIFGLGCAGGVLGLARAAALARAMPGQRVLLLVVELCGLTFRTSDLSKSNIIATVLFGDGAAGVLLSTDGEGPAVTGWAEHTWPGSLDVMGWRVEEDGLGVLFSQDIPQLVRRQARAAAERALAGQGLDLSGIDRLICHPGGAKVVDALEEAFGLSVGRLDAERAVLRDYGNMSAATVLFVLETVLAEQAGSEGVYLLMGLGPGFSAGFVTLKTAG